MAITRGQKSTIGQIGSGTTVTTTWGTNPTAGSKVIVCVQCGATPTSVKDNGAVQGTFTLDKSQTAGKGAFIYRLDGLHLPSSGSYAVTVTIASSGTIQAWGIELIGAATGAASATNSGTSTSTSVSTGAVAGAGYVIACFSDGNGANPSTVTYTGPGTSQVIVTNGSSFWPFAVADNLTSSSDTETWTVTSSTWGAAIATYAAAATPKLLSALAVHRSPQRIVRNSHSRGRF
jgi:hypothetical protein